MKTTEILELAQKISDDYWEKVIEEKYGQYQLSENFNQKRVK